MRACFELPVVVPEEESTTEEKICPEAAQMGGDGSRM